MIETTATLETPHAAKYIAQLCKHFAHKVDVTHSDGHGECRFVCGTAIMDANETSLLIRVSATDEDQSAETQDVIERHLVRFAFREELKPLKWQAVTNRLDIGTIASEG